LEKSKCENVEEAKDQCENSACLYEDICDLDKGEPYCFIASTDSRVMIDPYWFGGPEKHIKRTQVKTVLIFKKDNYGPVSEKLSPEKALQILEEGRPPVDAISELSHPFYNPYMLVKTTDRTEQQKRFYKRLLDKCECFLINTGAGSPKDVQKIIAEIAADRGKEVLR